jgi:ferredoxin-NADP reductase
MAETRTARLLQAKAMGAGPRFLRFGLDQDLGFIGGQYIIINTGIPLGEGKTAKRAYSLLSSDAEQRTFELTVWRVGEGPGSNYMLGLEVGTTLTFTGPWGKFLPSRLNEASSVEERPILVMATDTGITAALGLLRGCAFEQFLGRTHCYWFTDLEDAFLPPDFISQRLPRHVAHYERVQVPSGIAARAEWLAGRRFLSIVPASGDTPEAAFLSGDGFFLAAFRDALRQSSERTPVISVESFFNHQELKAMAKGIST